MTLPPLRLIRAAPAPPPPPRPRVEPAPALRYADFLRRENAIERHVDRPRIPYSDYLRSLPPRPGPADHADSAAGPRAGEPSRGACPSSACPTRRPNFPRLGDTSPTPAVRREIEVRTTYRVEVPLTSGRLIDVVM